ncbi:mitochondrial ribonuclease P protein 1 homolog [Pollicipes pollicipes]|uniref:mitochondrial ribonuclease P protein 1 homolog n=1 Tax=Pollicipes pollicipes TaxID=41117 RepID=UPI00188564DE|nr:mitochondrial ribonuclease P protein 1 homolog [Pollicipes pollicipes]XP_037077976.1 mitochondrial ribonuclease P protein 1 homolog [Pollicipes pollicipes]XP_037077977.1 mitochondrial ribonuclease P protein 1 homolog [Pollicipes pollicipes]XP_037077978.1 mitochondrial ribonuclease P protein 1 homolog [Pollicipes pollicipes]XP_037077979.1 mitochondrial ribonuclease P protein 1 homolog [Pollicipes pollicipes]
MLGRLLLARGARAGLSAALWPRRPLCAAAPSLERVSSALGLTEEDQRRRQLHLIMLEYGELQISGARVPDAPSPTDWGELLRLPTYSARRKYLAYLFKREKSRESDAARRRERVAARRELVETESRPAGHLQYGLGHNSIFHRISDITIKDWSEQRLYTAMRFGQPLVMDLGFEAHMTRRENKNTAQQLSMLFAQNRASLDPFDLHLCNVNRDGEIMEFLRRFIPTVEEPAFPMHLHAENYLDVYPRDRLVYLTPHCRHELTAFDHDAIYIVGGVVDLVKGRPVSLAKAKKEGLRMAKLPLTKYLSVGPSFSPSLTLVAMINILLELQSSGRWECALRHVPRRGLLTDEEKRARAETDLLRLQHAQAAAQRRQQRWERAQAAAARPAHSAGRDRPAQPPR